jgi:BMFP domain-containing protein YqiC
VLLPCLTAVQTLKSSAAVRGTGAAAAGSLRASVSGPKSALLASNSSSGSFKASTGGVSRKGPAAAAADPGQQQQMQQMQGQMQQQQETVQALSREMDMQRELIAKLRAELDAREEKIQSLEASAVVRPMSRERLPPMEAAGIAAAEAEAAGQLPASMLGGSSSIRGRPGSARPGSSSGSRRASAAEAQRVLSRPGSSDAGGSGGSSSRSGGVGRAASGLSAAAAATAVGLSGGDVDSREQELRSAGGMEPTPWETAGEGLSDTDAGEEWAGQPQQADVTEQQQAVGDSLAQQQTVMVE